MSINIEDFIKICDKINIIDIRSKQKYNDNHILNSKNIDKNDLLLNTNKYLNKSEKYYIYCQKGISSLKICKILRSRGYNVYSLLGGYEEWILRKY